MTDETTAEQIARLRREFDRGPAARIRADQDLTAQGKRNKLDEAWAPVMARIKRIEADERAARDKRRQEIERRQFGLSWGATGADVIARRDAEERAGRIRTADEARRALEDASSVGDRMLEAAIAHRVYRRAHDPIGGRPFGVVLDEYATQNPEFGRDLEELAGINSVQSQTQAVAAQLWGRAPSELRSSHPA